MANNTPNGFEDPALKVSVEFTEQDEELFYENYSHLLTERPHLRHLDTEDKNFEQGEDN